jgi:hypothetical protein
MRLSKGGNHREASVLSRETIASDRVLSWLLIGLALLRRVMAVSGWLSGFLPRRGERMPGDLYIKFVMRGSDGSEPSHSRVTNGGPDPEV